MLTFKNLLLQTLSNFFCHVSNIYSVCVLYFLGCVDNMEVHFMFRQKTWYHRQ